jgi:hypothetical protein
MKKIALFFILIAAAGFADNIELDNQTGYPLKNQKSKIAIQWASSAKEVEEGNHAVVQGLKLRPETLQVLTQPGTALLTIPQKAQYFRVVAWSKGEGEPDLLTNWVDIVPSKTYTLKGDYLVPSVLMVGTGC